MNWLTILMITIFIFCVMNGLRRGFIRTVAAMLSIFITLALVYFLNPYVSGFIKTNTPIYEKIEKKCEVTLKDTFQEQLGSVGEKELMEELPLPENMKQMILSNLNTEKAGNVLADALTQKTAGLIAGTAVNGISFFITLILVSLLIRIIVTALDGIFSLPVLNFVNRLGGAFAGGVQGLLLIWIFCLAVALFWSTEWGHNMAALLESNPLTKSLYDMNPFVKFISFKL